MFTKYDYINYFDQLARVERKMIYRAFDLAREINAPEVTRVLQQIGDDKVRHYGYILKMLHQSEEVMQLGDRRKKREFNLGGVLIRSVKDPSKKLRAYCVNLSELGACIEYENDDPLSGDWELAIRLFGQEESLKRRARFVWNKQVEPCFYVAGMEFFAPEVTKSP